MIWFTGDTHFGHELIILPCKRPFVSAAEMDEAILRNINESVRPEDTLYHLGDFSVGGGNVGPIRARIKCRNIVLVLGNHDPQTSDGTPKAAFGRNFSKVAVMMRVRVRIAQRTQLMILCHYPMRIWEDKREGSWHLHGHAHGGLHPEDDPGALDVGVDCHDFRPITVYEVAAKLSAFGSTA